MGSGLWALWGWPGQPTMARGNAPLLPTTDGAWALECCCLKAWPVLEGQSRGPNGACVTSFGRPIKAGMPDFLAFKLLKLFKLEKSLKLVPWPTFSGTHKIWVAPEFCFVVLSEPDGLQKVPKSCGNRQFPRMFVFSSFQVFVLADFSDTNLLAIIFAWIFASSENLLDGTQKVCSNIFAPLSNISASWSNTFFADFCS